MPAWAGLGYVGLDSQRGMAIGVIACVGQIMLLQPFVIVALAWPING
jgi:hypothetical protein